MHLVLYLSKLVIILVNVLNLLPINVFEFVLFQTLGSVLVEAFVYVSVAQLVTCGENI